nr:hypothetical protein ISGA_08860 [Gordonia sp. NB41Y]
MLENEATGCQRLMNLACVSFVNNSAMKLNAALPNSECAQAFCELAGVDERPQDVVGEVTEPEGDAAQMLERPLMASTGPLEAPVSK